MLLQAAPGGRTVVRSSLSRLPIQLPSVANLKRGACIITAAKKGFGKGTSQQQGNQSNGKGGQKVKSRPVQPALTVQPQDDKFNSYYAQAEAIEAEAKKQAEEDEFAERLATLKAEAAAKAAAPATPRPLDGKSTPVAAFDEKPDYASPPPILQTLRGTDDSISDPKLRNAAIGPSQAGLGVVAVVLVIIFLVVSGGEFASSKRYQGVAPAQTPPDGVEEKILLGRLSVLEDRLSANPSDADALEGLAVTSAKLFKFEKSAEYLDRLIKVQPEDFDAWRLYAETSLLSQQPKRSIAAYERALELKQAGKAPGTEISFLQLYTGLADALIANGDFAKAASFISNLRDKAAASASNPLAPAKVASVPASTSAVPVPSTPLQRVPRPAPVVDGVVLEAPASSDDTQPAASALPQSDSSPVSTTTAPSGNDASASLPAQGDAPSAAVASPRAPSLNGAPSIASTSFAAPPEAPDVVSLDLLLAKVYSSWRGHDNDALATYERAIAAAPEDFRGYLAKGLFLKERGRKADADRMFLQARFYAPASRQALVRTYSQSNPVVDLPDNN